MNVTKIVLGLYLSVMAVTHSAVGQELYQEPREIRDTDVRRSSATPLFKLVPYIDSNSTSGYRLLPGSDLVAINLGVEPDDIILRVNGILVTNQKILKRAYRKLAQSKSMELEILRDGETIHLTIPLQ